jgi:hypothetical protein
MTTYKARSAVLIVDEEPLRHFIADCAISCCEHEDHPFIGD